MAFLSKDELKTVTTVPLIDKLTASDDTIVTQIIDESIALMKSYLSKYYDVDAIFAAENSERNLNVLKRLKDICRYEIYDRLNNNITSVIKKYEEAMRWLEKLNSGEFYDRTLPKRIVDDTTDIATESDDVRFGGNTRYINDTFY